MSYMFPTTGICARCFRQGPLNPVPEIAPQPMVCGRCSRDISSVLSFITFYTAYRGTEAFETGGQDGQVTPTTNPASKRPPAKS